MNDQIYNNWKHMSSCFIMTEFGKQVQRSGHNGHEILPHAIFRALQDRNKDIRIGGVIQAIRQNYAHTPRMYEFRNKKRISVEELVADEAFREAIEYLIRHPPSIQDRRRLIDNWCRMTERAFLSEEEVALMHTSQ